VWTDKIALVIINDEWSKYIRPLPLLMPKQSVAVHLEHYVGELLFPTRVVHVSDYTQSGVITRAVHLVGKVGLVGNGKGLGIIWLVGNHQDP
jgi:hypothetical protein